MRSAEAGADVAAVVALYSTTDNCCSSNMLQIAYAGGLGINLSSAFKGCCLVLVCRQPMTPLACPATTSQPVCIWLSYPATFLFYCRHVCFTACLQEALDTLGLPCYHMLEVINRGDEKKWLAAAEGMPCC